MPSNHGVLVITVWSSCLSTTIQLCVSAPRCVWIEVCDVACMINDVCVVVEGNWWHLWLVAWLCHPHVCLFIIHHKWHSPHMSALCCTTALGWQEDLVTCHHALVGCFVTTPFPFPTTIVSSFSNHPFLFTSTSSLMLRDGLWGELDDSYQHSVFFLTNSVVGCLNASIL